MTTVIEAYLIPIIIALVIGLAIAWWAFSRRSAGTPRLSREADPAAPLERPYVRPPAAPVPAPAPSSAPTAARQAHEGHGIADSAAAATADVAGQIIGTQVHSELPGADGPPDNLQMLKGVGPKLAARLNENGITRFEQLAALTENEVAILEDKLGPFKGRLTRDRVVEQALYLARDDRDGFEARFGALGG
jgi:predicted flap endonuclease-1-like 5' DNA nuclease